MFIMASAKTNVFRNASLTPPSCASIGISTSLLNTQNINSRLNTQEGKYCDILPRLEFPALTASWCRTELLKAVKHVTRLIFCQGLEINRAQYEVRKDFVQEELMKGRNYKLAIGSNAGG
jgi:hypothetical protein